MGKEDDICVLGKLSQKLKHWIIQSELRVLTERIFSGMGCLKVIIILATLFFPCVYTPGTFLST